MASNPYVNKVALADGTTLIDLTGDSLQTAGQLLAGVTAHNKAGQSITGTWSLETNVFTVGSLWATYDDTADPAVTLGFGTWIRVSPIKPTWNRLKATTTWANMEIDAPTVFVWRRTA